MIGEQHSLVRKRETRFIDERLRIKILPSQFYIVFSFHLNSKKPGAKFLRQKIAIVRLKSSITLSSRNFCYNYTIKNRTVSRSILEFLNDTRISIEQILKAWLDYREELAAAGCCVAFNVPFIVKKKLKKKERGWFFSMMARAMQLTEGEGRGGGDTDVSHQHIIPWEYSGDGGTR